MRKQVNCRSLSCGLRPSWSLLIIPRHFKMLTTSIRRHKNIFMQDCSNELALDGWWDRYGHMHSNSLSTQNPRIWNKGYSSKIVYWQKALFCIIRWVLCHRICIPFPRKWLTDGFACVMLRYLTTRMHVHSHILALSFDIYRRSSWHVTQGLWCYFTPFPLSLDHD